jgi:hypothetical protein
MPSRTVYRIEPGEAGHWVVLDEANQPLFVGQDFRTPREAAAAVRDLAASKGVKAMSAVGERGQPRQVLVEGDLRDIAPVLVRITLTVSPEMDDLIDNLADELRTSKGDAILTGIRLLKLAADARREGKRLAIIDDETETEQDVVF